MSDEILRSISNISAKLQKLVANRRQLESELNRAREENKILIERQYALEEEVRQMKEQILLLRASANPLENDDKKEFQKILNEYIRNIDKCIALLKS